MKKRILFTTLLTLILTFCIGLAVSNAAEEPDKYITFEGFFAQLPNGDDSYKMEVENYGDEITLPENTFICEGEKFYGWEYNYKLYQPGEKIVAEEGGTVTTMFFYENNRGYITLDPVLRSWTIIASENEIDEEFTLASANEDFCGSEEIDMWFEGWNTKADGSGIWYKTGQSIELEDDEVLVLYAIWNDDLSKAYKVTIDPNFDYDENSNDYIGHIYVKKGDSVPANISVDFDGYDFAGFYDKPVGGTLLCDKNDYFTPKADTVLYAHWTKQKAVAADHPDTIYLEVDEWATPGEEVEVFALPVWDHALKSITVLDANGKAVKIEPLEYDNYYSFIMPDSDVTVAVTSEIDVPENRFTDVKKEDYFYNPVLWALKNDITTGIDASRFGPNQTVTRAQMVTFLWRQAGSPEPEYEDCGFSDVKKGDYYYDAVCWAVENDITKGTSSTKFSPDAKLTRAQAVTLMARNNWISDDEDYYTCDFVDVKDGAYYKTAVGWAAENNITTGTDATHFSPDEYCLRGQVVTFLFRNFAIEAEENEEAEE